MKITILAVTTLFLSGGTVFAACDHYGSQEVQGPATMSDPTHTFSNEIGNAGDLQTMSIKSSDDWSR